MRRLVHQAITDRIGLIPISRIYRASGHRRIRCQRKLQIPGRGILHSVLDHGGRTQDLQFIALLHQRQMSLIPVKFLVIQIITDMAEPAVLLCRDIYMILPRPRNRRIVNPLPGQADRVHTRPVTVGFNLAKRRLVLAIIGVRRVDIQMVAHDRPHLIAR